MAELITQIAWTDIMEMIRRHPNMRRSWRDCLLSACRQWVRRFEPVGMSAVIVPSEVSAVLQTATPAMARLSPASFSNMVSRVRAALRLAGLIVQPGRHSIEMAECWRELYEPMQTRWDRSRISRFFYTATRHGWTPEEITTEHFKFFFEELSQRAVIKRPLNVVKQAVGLWNQLAAETPGLHPAECFWRVRKPYTLAWNEYPATLVEEVNQLLTELGQTDFLSEDCRKPLRPSTLKLLNFRLRQICAALVHKGCAPGELRSLKQLCTFEAVQTALRFFHERSGGRITLQIIGLAEHLYSVAKHRRDVDPTDLEQIRKLVDKLRTFRRPGLTEKNQRRLSQFDAKKNRDALLTLPQKLRNAAKSGRASGHLSNARAAALMMTGTAIEILLMCPMRIANLAALDLKRHIRRDNSGPNPITHLFIPAEETKNSFEIHCQLPVSSASLLEEYIQDFRSYVPGAHLSSALFPSTHGKARSPKTFYAMIAKAGRQYAGVEINPHLFRHFAAKMYLDENPGGYEVVRRTLGHNSMNTTARSYVGQETGRSLRHYDQVILNLRDEANAKPGGRGRGRN